MRYAISKRRKLAQKGNTMMEFALIASVLFLLGFGVADFSRLFNTGNLVANAAAAGTQYGALSPAHYGDTAGIQNAALTDAQNPSNMVVTTSNMCACSIGGAAVTCPASCDVNQTPMRYVRVDVSMPFAPLFPYPGIPQSIPVSTTSMVRVQ